MLEFMVKYVVAILMLLILMVGCAPAENITAIRENAYQQGYDAGKDKGYIQGIADSKAGIDAMKQNSFTEGYKSGYEEAVANLDEILQGNQSGLTTTLPESRDLPGRFVGDKSTNTYHYPTCMSAQQISTANQAWAWYAKNLVLRGMSPCDICKPPK